jgi:hypothetical protein
MALKKRAKHTRPANTRITVSITIFSYRRPKQVPELAMHAHQVVYQEIKRTAAGLGIAGALSKWKATYQNEKRWSGLIAEVILINFCCQVA